VAGLVRASGAHLGAVVDAGGERLALVDDEGTVLTDDQALLAVLSLVTQTRGAPTVALPVDVSGAAGELLSQCGGTLCSTKLSSSDLMEVAASGGVDFAGDRSGGFLFPDFLPAFDAAAGLVAVASLLARTGQRLSKIVHDLPPVHIAHQTVVTPWDQKGHVMRALVEQLGQRDLILIDGVKVMEDDGWALVVPDPEEPLSHVWAEGPSDARAQARAQQYSVRIRQLMR